MYNTQKEKNEALIKTMKKDGYTDLGWANDGAELSNSSERRLTPVQEVDCSLYATRGTHMVYVDHDAKEILHVDMSD